jgi:hypothetical protein
VITNDPKITNEKDKQEDKDKDNKNKKKIDPKKDPDEIGNRDVGRGVNFYSLEKDIAMGKQYAQEIERQAGESRR